MPLFYSLMRTPDPTQRMARLSGPATFCFFCWLLALLLPGRVLAQTVYYVDATRLDNTGTGLSWTAAKKDLQEAINLATTTGDEVWVKAGTYKPTTVPTSATSAGGITVQDQAFYLFTADVKLYGGFAGTETAASQRNPVANLTTLSGDLNSGAGAADAHHVLLTINRTSACVIDGFTVRAGRADGSGTISVSSRTFARNGGGGLYTNNSSPTVSNCTFSSNSALSAGGGMYIQSNSSPTVRYCTFSGNTATGPFSTGVGAGMYESGSSSTVSDCTFSNNSATGSGGGMFTSNNATVVSCTFSENSASSGAGMYNSGNPVVNSCTFSRNAATIYGGGLYNDGFSSAAVSNSTFISNTAGASSFGGGSGGGMYTADGSITTMNTCTFNGNSAGLTGGGLYYTTNGGGSLTNCLLTSNRTSNVNDDNREEIFKAGTTASLSLTSCLVRDYSSTATFGVSPTFGTTIYTGSPGYVDEASPAGPDGLWRTADDGLRLACGGFAVDKGTGTTPATDILGNQRQGALDLGAYEAAGGSTSSNTIPAVYTTVSLVQPAATLPYTDCQNELLRLNAAAPYTLRGSTTATVFVQATALTFNTVPYVRRYFDIAPAANAATATAEATLHFTQADFADYNAARASRPSLPTSTADPEGYVANLRITQKHGTSSTGVPGSYTGWAGTGPATVFITPTAVVYNATAGRWEVTFPVTGFSGFFAHTGTAPLPVELSAFTATPEGKTAVRLAWATASEKNSQAFEAERSGDGRTFKRIGAVAAAGSSSASRSYELLDGELPAGTAVLYYRLRQVDSDNTFSYSPVRIVALAGPLAKGLTLSPNPARTTSLTGAKAGAAVHVFDAVGHLVLTATADANGTTQLVLPAILLTGMYVVRSGPYAVRLAVE